MSPLQKRTVRRGTRNEQYAILLSLKSTLETSKRWLRGYYRLRYLVNKFSGELPAAEQPEDEQPEDEQPEDKQPEDGQHKVEQHHKRKDVV